MKRLAWLLLALHLLLAAAFAGRFPPQVRAAAAARPHLVQPGDTWTALAWRYGLTPAEMEAYRSINRLRQPAIGAILALPDREVERSGQILRTDRGLLETAVLHQTSPWRIAIESGTEHFFAPVSYQPLIISGGSTPPRELPVGLNSLELSQIPAQPGQALGVRAIGQEGQEVRVALDGTPFAGFANGRYYVSVGGTGAFFGGGVPELTIQVDEHPLWSQPWLFVDQTWTFDDLTLTGSAAEIDQQAIQEERERLSAIWAEATAVPVWQTPFQVPLNSYLSVSSNYGARRSYNGGPYRTYHEGVDFAAYGGTPVFAANAGTVVIAENLFVRGGAVIINHGLGIYTGYYHMSEILVSTGEDVTPGQIVGEVGTTGLSTGNHLHWDLLVNATWVDAEQWLEQEMGCWILTGLGTECSGNNN